jgi:hypothetical protein
MSLVRSRAATLGHRGDCGDCGDCGGCDGCDGCGGCARPLRRGLFE